MFWDVLHAYKTVSSWHSVVTTEKDSRKLNPKIATPFDLSQMVTQAVRGPDLHTGDRNFGGHSILDILPFINRGKLLLFDRISWSKIILFYLYSLL